MRLSEWLRRHAMFHVLHSRGRVSGRARGAGRRPHPGRMPMWAPAVLLLSAAGALLAASISPGAAAAVSSPNVVVLHVDGEINAAVAAYLSSALAQAGRDRAGAVVLQMNTPGGIST